MANARAAVLRSLGADELTRFSGGTQEEPEVGGGLLVKLDASVGRATTPAAVAAQWFAQNIFEGADADDLETEEPAAKRARTATDSLAVRETASGPKEPDELLVPKAPKAADGQVSILYCGSF